MSGGHFDYQQYLIQNIADKIEQLILNNGKEDECHFLPETIEEFKIGLEHLRIACVYAQRIDWLVSGDDGEDTFHTRLQSELQKFEYNEIS